MKSATAVGVELEEEQSYLEGKVQECRTIRCMPSVPASRAIVLAKYERTFEERLAEIKREKEKLAADKAKE